MRGVILSGILVAAMGCATVGKVGVDTGGMGSRSSRRTGVRSSVGPPSGT
jgi:hypothetical protein